jgi:hypothetical protein
MTSTPFPGSPKLTRCGLLQVDPTSGSVLRVISLQYNPDTLTRTLAIQGIGDNGARTEVLRLKGPANETIKFEAELDATDQFEQPSVSANAATIQYGLHPRLAALESLVNPAVSDLIDQTTMAASGVLEIAPAESPLLLFVWSAQRVLPVRITECSITEEAFDPTLNPFRVKVSMSLRVLNVDDLPSSHRGTTLFLSYLQRKEYLATKAPAASLESLGIGAI